MAEILTVSQPLFLRSSTPPHSSSSSSSPPSLLVCSSPPTLSCHLLSDSPQEYFRTVLCTLSQLTTRPLTGALLRVCVASLVHMELNCAWEIIYDIDPIASVLPQCSLVIVAIVLCVAGFLWLKFNQGKESKVAAKTEEKQSTGNESLKTNQQQKPEAAAKKVKKDEKQKHHQCIFEVKGHKDGMNCFMFSGTGKLAASTGDDRRVIIWDATKVLHEGAVVFEDLIVYTRLPGSKVSADSAPGLKQQQNVIPELDHPVSVAFRHAKLVAYVVLIRLVNCSPDDSYFAVAYATSKEVPRTVQLLLRSDRLLQIKIFAVKGVKEGAKVYHPACPPAPLTGPSLQGLNQDQCGEIDHRDALVLQREVSRHMLH
eukprot:762928-Hanusia_phi.AAC.6